MRFTTLFPLLAALVGCQSVKQQTVPTGLSEDDAASLASMAARCAEVSECGGCVASTASEDDSRPLQCGWCASAQRCEPRRRAHVRGRGKSKDHCPEPLLENEPIACAVADDHFRKQAVDDFFRDQLNGYKRVGKTMKGAVKSGGHVALALTKGSCYRVSYLPVDAPAMTKASSAAIAVDIKTKKASATAKAAALAYGDEHFFASVWDIGCPKFSGKAVMNFPFDEEVAGKYELQMFKRARTKQDLLPPPKVEAVVAQADTSPASAVCRQCSDARQSCDGSRGHCTREYAACLARDGFMAADCQLKHH